MFKINVCLNAAQMLLQVISARDQERKMSALLFRIRFLFQIPNFEVRGLDLFLKCIEESF